MDKAKGRETTNVDKILSIIEEMKTADPSLPGDVQMIEGHAYNNLGQIAYREGTKESAKTAIEYFEKYREICEEADYAAGVTIAGSNLAKAKAKYEGRNSTSDMEIVEKYRKAYKQRIGSKGQEHTATLDAGAALAVALKNAHHGIEAERLLTKLVSISMRAHGPDHQITKSAKSDLQKIKVRRVRIKHQNGRTYQALRYEEDGEKCVIQGPIAKPRNIQAERTFSIASEGIIFKPGTPVICDGLKASTNLNGKMGDVRFYDEDIEGFKIYFEEEGLEPWPVKAKFLRILFELPEES